MDSFQSKKSPRPESVPALQLEQLGPEVKDVSTLLNPITKQRSILSPSAHSTISWGTPSSVPHKLTTNDIQYGGTIHRPCSHIQHRGIKKQQERNPITFQVRKHENKSEDKYQHNDKSKQSTTSPPKANEKVFTPKREVVVVNKQVFFKEPEHKPSSDETTYKKADHKSKYWYVNESDRDPPTPKVDDGPDPNSVDNVANLQTQYTSQPYTDMQEMRMFAAENDLMKKRQEEVIEQVLVDQLSRHVISDVEQDSDPARQNPANPASFYNTAPLRFKSRRLHDTKVSTAGAATESKLKDRVVFGARFVTRDGRDALRELFGFFFLSDSTLTVYEFRIFGKSNKALPIIERGNYSHIIGRRRGKAYNEDDFQLGRNLTFETNKQSRLPDSLKMNNVVTIRICESKSSLSSGGFWSESSHRNDGSDSALERQDRKITANVQKFIRNSLSNRSVSVIIGLGKLFRTLDRSGDGLLSKDELASALGTFDIHLPDKDFESVWRVVDENNDGAIDYGEFLRAFIGEMNELRKALVRKVFKKIDPHKTGMTSIMNIEKLYSAKRHPSVLKGELTQQQMEKQFLDSFVENIATEDGVSFVEFEEYYEGLSLSIESDENFVNMMRNCWGV